MRQRDGPEREALGAGEVKGWGGEWGGGGQKTQAGAGERAPLLRGPYYRGGDSGVGTYILRFPGGASVGSGIET